MDFSVGFIFSKFTVDIPSVSDLDNPYGQFIILDRVDDSVIPLTDSETVLSRDFFTSLGSGIMCKFFNLFYDAFKFIFRNFSQIFQNGSTEVDFIYGHSFSTLPALLQKREEVRRSFR